MWIKAIFLVCTYNSVAAVIDLRLTGFPAIVSKVKGAAAYASAVSILHGNIESKESSPVRLGFLLV